MGSGPYQAAKANGGDAGAFALPRLPFTIGALAPVISSRTMQYHHGRHHARYVEDANRLAVGRPELAGMSAPEIVRWAAAAEGEAELFNKSSQAWNHAFFWKCLSPTRQRPTGALLHALERDFGDYARFAHEFASAGDRHFGNGWLWLVVDERRRLRILTTRGAASPMIDGETCLLAIDLWEHAYYLDHQDRRREYLDGVIDRRLNWEEARRHFMTSEAGPMGGP